MENSVSVKLSFRLVGNSKRCSQTVPINVADTIPLFRKTGKSEYLEHETTLVALTIYWKYYKKSIPIPLVYRLQDKLDFLKLATYLEEPLNSYGIPEGVLCEMYMTSEELNRGEPLHLARQCITVRHFLQPIPRTWNKSIILEKEDNDTIFTLLLCFRSYGFKCPVEILVIIFNFCDFYEDWNRIVFANLSHLPIVKDYLIVDYYDYCFSSRQMSLTDKIRTFARVWPDMATLIWKKFDRVYLANDLNVPTKRRAQFLKVKTIGELVEYFERIGEKPGPILDAHEASLMAILDSDPSMLVEYKTREALAKYRRGKRFDAPRLGKVERELFKKI
jgi:hypothetical protein